MWISEFSGLLIFIFGSVKIVWAMGMALTRQLRQKSICGEEVEAAITMGCNVVTNFNQQNSLRRST